MFEQTFSAKHASSSVLAALPLLRTDTALFDSIPDALAALKAGEAVVVVDDEDRENEGDLICAAQFATPAMVNFMAVHGRGLICLAMTNERLDQLKLPLMVNANTDHYQTAFTVSIDAARHLGVTTGTSAADRARTIQAAIDPLTQARDLIRPGHVFPLRAQAGGVLKRAGHTEAAVDLARLAELYPAGVICEIQNPNGSMARLPELITYAKTHNLRIITIGDLINYRLKKEHFISREAVAHLPTEFGDFQVYGYRNTLDGSEAVALVKGVPSQLIKQSVLVSIHSECLIGNVLGSLGCKCLAQLQTAFRLIASAQQGVVVYLRQEGEGICLNKLKADSLQDRNLETLAATKKLRFTSDLCAYVGGAQILQDLGLRRIRLLTSDPGQAVKLSNWDLNIVECVPLEIQVNTC